MTSAVRGCASSILPPARPPAASFLATAATPTAFVVPRSANASAGWQTVDSFVGSGPYVIRRRDGADLVLGANDRYVAGAPPIDQIRLIAAVYGDVATAFDAGTIDLAGIGTPDAGWVASDWPRRPPP